MSKFRRAVTGAGVIALMLTMNERAHAETTGYRWVYGFGSVPSSADLAHAANLSSQPDGHDLPAGRGDYAQGQKLYAAQCAACHGEGLKGPGVGGELIGGRGSLASEKPVKTVESYWPYATTLFDYVKRAMPFNSPGSLTNDEVYALCAYILTEAKITTASQIMDDKALAKVEMPNRQGFVPDPRPEIELYR